MLDRSVCVCAYSQTMILFDTPGREQLSSWAAASGLGPSEIARRLGVTTTGKPVNPSLVSRWLSGVSRPDATYKPRLKQLADIDDDAWLTIEERAAISSPGRGVG